jgi:Ca2+-binding EF-hand superfamily protein
MNKVQFRKFFQQFADPNDRNGATAEYVIILFEFLCKSLYYFSKIFTVFDQNKDGSMNFNEFVIACGVLLNSDLNSQLELAFTM